MTVELEGAVLQTRKYTSDLLTLTCNSHSPTLNMMRQVCSNAHTDTTPDGSRLLNKPTDTMKEVVRDFYCCTMVSLPSSTKQHISALLLNRDFKTSSFLSDPPLVFHTTAERLLTWLIHVPLQVVHTRCTHGAPPTPRLPLRTVSQLPIVQASSPSFLELGPCSRLLLLLQRSQVII